MDERKQRILRAIIEDYVKSAEPVGSRTIAKNYNLGISPARCETKWLILRT